MKRIESFSMKRMALTLCVSAQLFSCLNAMDSTQREQVVDNQKQASTVVFVVQTVPPVEVVVSSAAQRVIFEKFLIAPTINMQCKSFNGIRFEGPFNVNCNMTVEQVIKALHTAFGADKAINIYRQ